MGMCLAPFILPSPKVCNTKCGYIGYSRVDCPLCQKIRTVESIRNEDWLILRRLAEMIVRSDCRLSPWVSCIMIRPIKCQLYDIKETSSRFPFAKNRRSIFTFHPVVSLFVAAVFGTGGLLKKSGHSCWHSL